MEEFIINEIVNLKKNKQTYFNEEFKEFNLKSSEIKLIHILSFIEGESQAELAKRLDCDKAHIHRIVIKLLMKKIIFISNEKQRNCRNLKIRLTEHGKEISQKINKKMEEWKSKLIKGISQEDFDAIKRVFAKLNENLNKENKNV